MPFKSRAQRRKFAALLMSGEITPEQYERWNRETGRKELPERVKPKKHKTKRKPKGRRKMNRFAVSTMLLIGLPACTQVRPVTTQPTPANIAEYLRTHSHATLRVTDSTGRGRWVYNTSMNGDTLLGSRTSTGRREPVVIPIGQLSAVGAQEFNVRRTVGLVAATVLAVVGWMALTAPKPVY